MGKQHKSKGKNKPTNNKNQQKPKSTSKKTTTLITQPPKFIFQIGYYPIRGKAQVPRLIMQYLHVPYTDRLYELQQWNNFKNQIAQDEEWDFVDVPYLIDNEPVNKQKYKRFIVTDAFPICQYVIYKYNREDLLGRTIADKGIIQMYLWTIDTMSSIISINCSKKLAHETIQEFKQHQWKSNVQPRLEKYQNFIRNSYSVDEHGQEHTTCWFLGYLTILDFSVYELVRYIDMLFPGNLQCIPKMKRITDQVYRIPEIHHYQNSIRAIKQMDPSVLLKKLHNK